MWPINSTPAQFHVKSHVKSCCAEDKSEKLFSVRAVNLIFCPHSNPAWDGLGTAIYDTEIIIETAVAGEN